MVIGGIRRGSWMGLEIVLLRTCWSSIGKIQGQYRGFRKGACWPIPWRRNKEKGMWVQYQ